MRDDIDAVVCVRVHGFNCAHLPAPPPSLVQHQAKARAEPGGVWRVLSLPYSWAYNSTSGNNLSESPECIHIRDVLVHQVYHSTTVKHYDGNSFDLPC